jgi:hypothetical protein
VEGRTESIGVESFDLGQESDVGKVFCARVLSLARQRVRVKLLGDVDDAREM